MTRTEYTQAKGKYLAFLPSSKADSVNTLKNYMRVLNDFEKYLTEKICNENGISTVDVLGYRAAIRERGAAQNTARQYLTDLSAFFAWCVRVKLIEENPVMPDDIPEQKDIEYTLLTRAEIDALFEYRPTGAKLGARNRAIIIMLLQSGLRNSEVRALTLSDLDFERGEITVRHGKGDKSRLAPFPALSREAVKEYLTSGYRASDAPESAYLFGTYANENGKSNGENAQEWHEIGSNALNDIVKRYVKHVTGKEVHAHTLRHAAASLWDDLGAPMRTIQNGLGHASVRTTERIYVTVLNKHKAAEDLTAALDGNKTRNDFYTEG